MIKLNDVHRDYKMGDDIVKALDGIDVSIEKNDFVAIMGPSGSGKSTMMNMVGALDLATKGDILLDGENIELFDESHLAEIRGRKIGFIFQQFNLIPTLTAKENVMLPMLFQGYDLEERETTAEKLLEMVGLSDRLEHYPNQLSGGQQQRVSIARSLANNPEVILADEPTGNLDSKTEKKIMEFLTDLNKKGKTVIIVTHAPEIAEKYAKKIYWLRDGRVERVTKKFGSRWKTVNKKNKLK
ncbi:ABC transporter ATP-binding protein [Candidatus Pacearchaeota archaeon]|nr:ABC transporter ATP-binding protein [Candidatus Pacearchaeota archaeon]